MKMRKLLAVFAVLVLAMGFAQTARAEDPDKEVLLKELEEGVKQQITQLDLSGLQEMLDSLPQEVKKLTGLNVGETITALIDGTAVLDANNFFQVILQIFLGEIKNNAFFFLQIALLVILGGMLKNMLPDVGSESVSEIAQFACYALIAALIASNLAALIISSREAVANMGALLQAAFPMLLTLLTALGGIYSAGIFQPVVPLITAISGFFMRDVMLPMVPVYGVLTMVSNISERVQIKKLAVLSGTVCKWLIGIVFTVFLGVMTIQGISAGSFDGITIRTAKFAIDKFVPVVGRMFSDTVDTMLGCSLLVKNALGTVTLLMLSAVALFPLIQLISSIFMFKASAALLEPVGDARIVQCLNDMAGVVTVLFIIVLSLGAMMFIAVSLLIGAGNASMMMR
ncbi:MAG: stage III sporulation protein AE [Bacillota bacterium]|nr:stage III sporulation protein AE [Bacillota bacterium]